MTVHETDRGRGTASGSRSGRPTVVVFDLGGVLVQLGGVQQMAAWCGGIPESVLWERWLGCRWVRDFERGRCDADAFAAGVVDDWQLTIAPPAFLAAFRRWPIGVEEGARELLNEVGAQVATACLSNTNPLHWADQVTRGFGLESMFDHTFLSHELGMVKPDGEIFEHVTSALARPARDVLFLDDNILNVDAARDAGWRAERVQGVAEARAALERHGVLAR